MGICDGFGSLLSLVLCSSRRIDLRVLYRRVGWLSRGSLTSSLETVGDEALALRFDLVDMVVMLFAYCDQGSETRPVTDCKRASCHRQPHCTAGGALLCTSEGKRLVFTVAMHLLTGFVLLARASDALYELQVQGSQRPCSVTAQHPLRLAVGTADCTAATTASQHQQHRQQSCSNLKNYSDKQLQPSD